MRCVGENVICAWLFALFYGADFTADGDEGVAETIEFT
jgi:hypothetical protein